MSILNYRYCGFECNYEMKGDVKTIVDEFKNHITKERRVDHPKKKILTNAILRKKP